MFASLFVLPWYITAGLAIVGLLLFRKFWEIIALGFLIDALYSAPDAEIIGRFGFFTIISAILFLAVSTMRKQIRMRYV